MQINDQRTTTFKHNWLRLVPLALSSGDSISIPTKEDQLNAIFQIDKSFQAGHLTNCLLLLKFLKKLINVLVIARLLCDNARASELLNS